MGTNYYAIPRIDDKEKIAIKQAIDANDFELARNLLPNKIHIGKSSVGWVFIFNHHDWDHFEPRQEAVKDFLQKCQIIDEYGHSETFDEFWTLVEGKQGKNHQGHMAEYDGLYFSHYTEFS